MPAGVADGALIIDTRLDNSGFIRNANQFRRAVEGLKASADRVGRTLAGSADGYIRALNQASGATRDLDRQIRQLETEAARLQRGMSAAGASEGYKALGDQIKATEEQIDALQAKQREWADMGIAPDSAPFEALDQQIFELLDRLDALKAKQQDMESSGDAYAPGLEQMKADYAEIQRQLEALRAARDEALSTPPGWKDMATVTGAVASAMERVKQAMATALYAFQHPAEAIDRGFAAIAASAVKAASAIARLAGSAALGFLRRLAEGAKNAAIQFARLASGAMQAGVARLGSGFKSLGQWIAGGAKSLLHFNRANAGASGGLNLSLKNVLKYAFGIRSLYVLFNRLRTAVKEGMGEIAKQNPTVNAQLKTMKAALNGLKGSLATAFAPIFSAVAPALTRLINMLTSAINAIGAFIAALTGQRTYQKAVAGISGAGDAASSAGSAASDAADAYKDLKREIASFDELDVLGSADKSSSGSGGGGGGGGGGISYETEEIASGITDFIGKLKQMWENADYEGIGRTIAGTINSAFAKAKELISWSNLEATVTQAVNGITGVFNGLVDGVDWTLIGETFGEGVNTIIEATNLLLTGIDWENLGKSIAEGLNGLVSTVNWKKLGETFAAKINAVIGTIKGAVTGFDWEEAGKAFVDTVNGLFTSIDWAGLETTVTEAINGLFASMRIAVSGFDWTYATKTLAALINGLFKDTDWDALTATATTAINSMIASMRLLVSQFDWDYAAKTIASTISKLFDETDWDGLEKLASDGLNKIVASMRTLIAGFDWGYAGTTFANTLNKFFQDFDWANLGALVADGLAAPLATLRTTVAGFDWGYAGASFAETVNAFFANEQIWADAGTIVSDAIKGLFTWGTDFLNNLDTAQIAEDVKLALKSVDWKGIAGAIWGFLKAAFAGLGNFLIELLTSGPEPTEEDQQAIVDHLLGKAPENISRDYTVNLGLRIEFPEEQIAYFQIQEAIQKHLDAGDFNFEVPVGLDVPDETVTAAKQEFVNRWNSLHPEAPVALNPETGKIEQVKTELESNPIDAHVDLSKGTVDPTAQGILDADDKKVEVSANATATGDTSNVLKLSEITNEKVNKPVETTSKANGDPSKVLEVSKVKGDKINKTVDTTSKANGDPGQVLKVSNVTNDKVNKQVDTTSKANGDPNKVLDVSKVKKTTVNKTVNTSSKAKGDPNKVLKVADISTSKKTKDVNTDSEAKGEPNKVLDVAGISTTTKTKQVNVKAVGMGDFNRVYKVLTAGNNIKKTITVDFKATGDSKAKEAYGNARGGVISNGGFLRRFASGGILRGGIARYLSSVPHYAGGTSRAHGTVFVAGEAGPEIMGHINGRTEILNKSQLADAMYAAVVAGMGKAVNALGRYLANQMANCANAITASIGNAGELAAVAGLRFNAPALASGTVLPYEVAAQVARSTVELQRTLDANNEDLIQTIISVAGQIVAAVQAQGNRAPATGSAGGMTARQIIDDINRQAQMLGSSPLLD